LVGFVEWGIVSFSNWDKEVRKAFKRMDRRSIAEQGLLNGTADYEAEDQAEAPWQPSEES
jgi:MATE family multidrug resistance protein